MINAALDIADDHSCLNYTKSISNKSMPKYVNDFLNISDDELISASMKVKEKLQQNDESFASTSRFKRPIEDTEIDMI